MGKRFIQFDDGVEIEVMRVGEYPQGNVTEQDIDDMVSTYDPRLHEATVNLDHGDPNKKLARISALRRAGNTMVARLTAITDSLRNLAREGLLNGFSIEVRRRMEQTGKKYLWGLAALVNFQPAVDGLATAQFADGNFGVSFYFEQQTREGLNMDLEALKTWFTQQLSALTDQFKELKQKFSATDPTATDKIKESMDAAVAKLTTEFNAQFANANAEIAKGKAAQERLAQIDAEHRRDGILAFCAKLSDDGKFVPAFAKMGAVAFMEYLSTSADKIVKYKDAKDTSIEVTPLAWFQGFLEAAKPIVNFAEIVTPELHGKGARSAKDEWDAEVKKYMEEKKVTQNVAIRILMHSRDELYKKVREEAQAVQ